jgi:hypothetical protein
VTAPGLVPPDLSRLSDPDLLRLTADAKRLLPAPTGTFPTGTLPVLDRWMFVGRATDLLYARGYLDGGAERLRLPLLAVVPERPAVWLVGAAWVELGAHAFLESHTLEDGEELAALLLSAQQWCDALRWELRHAH